MMWAVIVPPWLFFTWVLIDLVVGISVATLEGGMTTTIHLLIAHQPMCLLRFGKHRKMGGL